METKKRVAIEKSALYMLVKWHNLDEFDYNGIVQKLYNEHKLMPSKLKTTDLAKAPLMQDGWVRTVWKSEEGDKYFQNIEVLIYLYKVCMSGEIELNIVPSVLQGVLHDVNMLTGDVQKVANLTLPFIQQYAKVLRVNEEDYDEFFEARRKLAQQYIDADILRDTQLPQACALAESAVFGLHYVVKREDIYLHQDMRLRDCLKMKKIASINRDGGMVAVDKYDDQYIVPKVWQMLHLMFKDRAWERGKLPYHLWIDPKNIEDGAYVAKSKR